MAAQTGRLACDLQIQFCMMLNIMRAASYLAAEVEALMRWEVVA